MLSRGYNMKSLKQASEKALVTPRSETLTYKVKLDHKRPPTVVTHNPCNPPLKLQRDVIIPNDQIRRVLLEPPLIAERNCKSLKNHLIPTRLPAPGNFKCDRSKCLTCQQHLVETGNFRSERTGEVFTIRHKMTLRFPQHLVPSLLRHMQPHPVHWGKKKKKKSEDQVLPTPVQYQHKHRHSCHQTFQLTEPHICKHEMSCNREGAHR